MMTRGNPFNEEHGKDMRVVTWVAPVNTDHLAIVAAAESALGVRLMARTPGDSVHGFLMFVDHDDGVHVTVCLYDEPCTEAACKTKHAVFTIAKTPTAAAITAMIAAANKGRARAPRPGPRRHG